MPSTKSTILSSRTIAFLQGEVVFITEPALCLLTTTQPGGPATREHNGNLILLTPDVQTWRKYYSGRGQ